eukprot:14241869-Ditylum_brightwellii.AAC.1
MLRQAVVRSEEIKTYPTKRKRDDDSTSVKKGKRDVEEDNDSTSEYNIKEDSAYINLFAMQQRILKGMLELENIGNISCSQDKMENAIIVGKEKSFSNEERHKIITDQRFSGSVVSCVSEDLSARDIDDCSFEAPLDFRKEHPFDMEMEFIL